MDSGKSDDVRVHVQLATLGSEIKTLTDVVAKLTMEVSELKKPRPTNWIGIAGFCLLALSPAVTVLTMYVNSQIEPMKQTLAYEQREKEWYYDNMEKHLGHYEWVQGKMFERVYGEAMPPFIPSPKK